MKLISARTAWLGLVAGLLVAALARAEGPAPVPKPLTTMQVMAQTVDADWRQPRAEDLLIMQLEAGRIIIELAPIFAPEHVNNILTLVNGGWFDGLSINRVQDNFVAQWGDPDNSKPLGEASVSLAGEFSRPRTKDLSWYLLPDGDVYAPQVGWVNGFAAARDVASDKAWLAHCYGTIGVGRDSAADSGNGAELYAVIGHAPRQLDRNITVVGRVLQGMEWLSSLPRGTGPLGFYEEEQERVRIVSITQASRLPEAERPKIEILHTHRPIFDLFVESRRNRRDEWYLIPAGHIDLCNVVVPVRSREQPQ
jgi:peptidylprolyl isomerase